MNAPNHKTDVQDELTTIPQQVGDDKSSNPQKSNWFGSGTLIIVASLFVLLFTFYGFTEPPSSFGSRFSYAGWAIMGWFGLLSFAYGLAGAVFATLKKHFVLAVVGASFPLFSSIVEWVTIINAPFSGVGMYGGVFELILFQILFSVLGIAAVAVFKKAIQLTVSASCQFSAHSFCGVG